MLLHVAAHIQFKMMLLAFKAVNGTAPVYLQTLVRPHAPARAQLASWYDHCWEQTKPAQQSHGSSLFWHLSGGTNSQPMSGQWNHSPSSAKNSRLICSDVTSTPHSMTSWRKCVCSISSVKHLYGVIFVSNVARAKTHLHKRRSLSRVNYSVSRIQISTAARTLVWSSHTYSVTEWQPHTQQGCAAALCALSLSLLCARLRWSSACSKQTFDIFGEETKANPGPLMIGNFPAPPRG